MRAFFERTLTTAPAACKRRLSFTFQPSPSALKRPGEKLDPEPVEGWWLCRAPLRQSLAACFMVKPSMVTPSADGVPVIQWRLTVTSTALPVGSEPRTTRLLLSTLNCPGPGPAPDATCTCAAPLTKTCAGQAHRRVPASHETSSWGNLGSDLELWKSPLEFFVQPPQTSEPRISEPGCPTSVSGLVILTCSR